MDLEETTNSWTLGGLIGAFIDLFIAYFLLCGSAFAFIAFKFFNFFGLHLPCPSCKGSFGFKNSNFCLHKVLFEWPLKKISSVEVMAAKRFPFDLVWVKKGQSSCNAGDNVVVEKTYDSNRIVAMEDETHWSSCSGFSLVDRESDAKGKRTVSSKRRSGIRRRRRGTSYDCGKISLVAHSDHASGKEVDDCYNEDAQTSHDLDEKTCHSYSFNGSMVDSSGQENYPSSWERHTNILKEKLEIIGNEDDRIKMLENALEEEKIAYAALYSELEKERSAAAGAADEAMAMILRLQEEKASMELEMKHYQSIIEERIAYDAEEMNILHEILIRRELEIYSLEEELEGYRQMSPKGSCESNDEPKEEPEEWGQSFETCDEPAQTESTVSIVKNDDIADISSDCNVAQNCTNTEHGEELEKNTEHKDQAQVSDDLDSVFYDTESDVHDVRVINDNIEHRERKNKKLITLSNRKPPKPYPRQCRSSSTSPWRNRTENDKNVDGSTSQLSMFYNSRSKSLPFDSGSDSSCASYEGKLKIDDEIEILEERLRMVKQEKEKLTSFAGKGVGGKSRFKLLEDLANHLQQIKQTTNLVRGASLPPSPRPKVSLKNKRSQSGSWNTSESC